MTASLDYHEIESLLLSHNAVMSPAEAHGTLSGMLCVDLQFDVDQWLMEVLDNEVNAVGEADLITLVTLFEETQRCLDEARFEFNIVLPGDNVALQARVCALGEWCRGFLYGLGYGGDQSQWSGDCNEILRDIADISRLDFEVEGEENEQAYMELTEYVRVGVQLIQTELQKPSAQPPPLH